MPAPRVVTARDVRNGVLATLQTWLPHVLAETARQAGYDPTAVVQPRSWRRLPDFAAAREDQLPAVVVTSPGLTGAPRQDGDGVYWAAWTVVVTTIIRGKNYDDTADLVGIYTAAVRTACLQHPTHGGMAQATRWTAEDYDAIEASAARTLGAGVVEFTVSVSDAADVRGLLTVPLDPLAPWPSEPQATDTNLTVHPGLA